MASCSGDVAYNKASTIVVNGVKMTMKEFQEYLKSKNNAKPKKRKRQKKTEIQELPSYLKKLIRNSGPIKSLASYYDNGYRQWGTICRTIMELPEINSAFLSFRSKAYRLESKLKEITEIGKHDEKAIFEYIRKLSWILDDIKKEMIALHNGVRESGVLERFKDKECINGVGRRLGLQILMTRTDVSIDKMAEVITEIEKMADKGLDAMDYVAVSKNRTIRVHR